MSDGLVSLAALRTARMLKDNAPPAHLDSFVAQMTELARQHGDGARETFWREVTALVAQAPAALPRSDRRRRSGAAHG